MFSFEFATAGRIIFGAGKLNELGKQIEGAATRLLLVRGGILRCDPTCEGDPVCDRYSIHGV